MRVLRIAKNRRRAHRHRPPRCRAGPAGRSAGTRQPLIPEGASDNFSSSVVNFERGATTGWHTHASDQILVITSGIGAVATEGEEHEVTVGDVVHIRQGENHWHGAKAESYMSHITITAV